MKKAKLDFKNLGFKYRKIPKRFVAEYKDGKWNNGKLTSKEKVVLNESSCVLQYSQTVFEGLKAYETKNGDIVFFRADLNAERLYDSCVRMKIPPYDKEKFIDAVKQVVKANKKYVPPYGTGASLYIRPYVYGKDAVLGVKPATEYEFRVFATPVGPYFSGGIKPLKVRISDLDRAAPKGTGHIKAGLNYAMSLYNIADAHEKGYDENLYLDSKTKTYIEETGGANIIFIDKEGKLVTPKSPTILPSITRRSLLVVAKDYLGMQVEERQINVNELENFVECGLCGTAAVISPIGKIVNGDKEIEYKTHEKLLKLLETLKSIQMCEIPAPKGWIFKVD